MVKSSSILKKLFHFSKKKQTSAHGDNTVTVEIPADALPIIVPNPGRADVIPNSKLISATGLNESHSTPSSPATLSYGAAFRSRLNGVRSGWGGVEQEIADMGTKFKRLDAGTRLSGVDSTGQEDGIRGIEELWNMELSAEMRKLGIEPHTYPSEEALWSPTPPVLDGADPSSPLDIPSSDVDAWLRRGPTPPIPPSPTLSTASSVHFATSVALRDPDGSSSLGPLNIDPSLTKMHKRKQSWTSSGGDDQFSRALSRRRSSILVSPPLTLSRQSSVHFGTDVVVRRKTSGEAFSSRRSSLRVLSTSPARSVQSSIQFSASGGHRSSGAYDDDAGLHNTVKGSTSRLLRPRSKSRSALPWSVHRLQLPPPVGLGISSVNFPSPSPFPRSDYAIHTTPTQSGEFFLFGGVVDGKPLKDLYRFSTRDRSATLLQTAGDIPSRRSGHASALVSNVLVLWGGNTKRNGHTEDYDKRLYTLNLGSREWTRTDVHSHSPLGRNGHTIIPVGSHLFMFGGRVDSRYLNDIWSLDFDSLGSTPVWQSYEFPSGSEIPAARAGHVSVSYGDKIFIFGGIGEKSHYYNDIWSFDTSTRSWSKLQCTGSIPDPRQGHAAALVGDIMYIFGGRGEGEEECGLPGLFALVISSQRWYSFDDIGPEPSGRSSHTMMSVGPKVFLLGGASALSKTEDHELIHILDTTYLRYVDSCSSKPPTPNSLPNPESIVRQRPDLKSGSSPGGICSQLLDPDHDNSETGSHSSSDGIEIPWFDSDSTDANISMTLTQKLDTENDGPRTQTDIGLLSSKTVPSVTAHVPSPMETLYNQRRRIVVTDSSSSECDMGGSDDEWSEDINVYESGKKVDISTSGDVPSVVQTQHDTLVKVTEASFSNRDSPEAAILATLPNTQGRHSPLIVAQTLQQSHWSKPYPIPDLTKDQALLQTEDSQDAHPATDNGYGTESHEDLPKVYKNLVSLLRKRISKLRFSPQNTDHSDTLEALVQRMKVDSTILSLVRSSQYKTQLMALSSTIHCHDDHQIHNALDQDETDIVRLLQSILNCELDKKTVLELRGDDAEHFLTLTHNVIDRQGFPYDDDGQRSRHRAHRLLVKLSQNCGILPSFLSIIGIENCGKEPVAGGGFADIFRASYQGEDVALKRLRDFQVHQQREIIHRRFCREAVLWQDLKHPNVLPFYGIDLETFLPRLSMVSPWMQHGTILKHITDIGGPLTANVDRYLLEIAEGLQYLHSRNIVHGDLRGTNIFIDDQWHVRLADFGLAGFADATLVTHTSNNAGSVRWMAPELHNPEIFGLKELRRTVASDIYALGCVALEIYTGNYPFSDTLRDGAVILKVMHGQRPSRPPPDMGRPISDDLWSLIRLCWRQLPADRPKMLDVVERLKTISVEMQPSIAYP